MNLKHLTYWTVLFSLLLVSCGKGNNPSNNVPPPPSGNTEEEEQPKDDTPKPWDDNRGKVVRPTAGGGWTISTVEPGIIYYAFDGYDGVSGATQRIFVTEIDLNNTNYEVKLVWRANGATASSVFSSTGAIACINAGYEKAALWIQLNGSTYSSISAETIGTTGVPQWKSEAAVYMDQARDVRIRFTGRNKDLQGWRDIYAYKAGAGGEKTFITSAPMLVSDYEPVGMDFCALHPKANWGPDCSENPFNHQGSLTNPRTALAQTAEGQLFFIVVDGRRGTSVARGISCSQLTAFLVKYFNPQYAINMDGGGSSTMVVQGLGDPTTHVVNYPTDSDQVSGVPDHSGERSRDTFFIVKRK